MDNNYNNNQINYNNSNQLSYNGDGQLSQINNSQVNSSQMYNNQENNSRMYNNQENNSQMYNNQENNSQTYDNQAYNGYQTIYALERQWQPNNNLEEPKKAEKVKAKKEKKPKKPLSFKKVLATCTAFMLVTVLANSAILYAMYDSIREDYMTKSEYASESIKSTSDTIGNFETNSGTTLSVAQIAEAVMPSVVAITSTSIVESVSPFWGYGGSSQVQGAGSGIIVGKNDKELLVVTNNHVVEDTTSLTVQFTNQVSVDQAYVKGTSADNDIAMVAIPLSAIDADTIRYIKIATLGDSDEMRVGDGVIAIGNALGYGQSVTVGYVSAKDRDITTENTTLTVIQTDAAINGGNSGGALLNMKGEVIGINVAKSSSSSFTEASVEGMGYAIPISHAKDIIDELSSKETRLPVAEGDKGYLGVKVMTSDESAYEYYNIPKGAYVREVVEDGPADKAGIVAGDVIVAIDGTSISTADELLDVLGTYAAGEKVTIKVMARTSRDYEEKEFTITLVEQEKVS